MIAIKAAFILSFILAGPTAFAFPEMIGHGYQLCRSCHYATGGGGPTTAYGKGIAEEISTWAYKGEGDSFYGLFSLAPLAIHSDSRLLAYRYEDAEVRVTSRFWMQRELSLSIDLAKNIAAVTSCGEYGYEPEGTECRTYYATLDVGPIRLRGGRFLPVFGLNISDHTKAIKDLFKEGLESFNAETSIHSDYFEIIYTRLYGRRTAGLEGSRYPRITTQSDGDGYAFKASLFPLRGVQLSYSYAELTEDGGTSLNKVAAYTLFMGTRRIALEAEYQKLGIHEKGYAAIILQPLKGVWLKSEADYFSDPGVVAQTEIFGTVQWLPRPHLDFTFTASEKRLIFVSHFYL